MFGLNRIRLVNAGVLSLICVLVMAFELLVPSYAFAAEKGPEISEATAYMVMDQDGNQLAALNEEQELPMASITKVMTAIVALDSHKPFSDVCKVHKVDLEEGAQAAGFNTDQTLTFEQLLNVMLVYSANDAAELVAENVAGSKEAFVGLMNKKAQEIGMTHTHFMNPTGLEDPKHYSCAKDLITMGRYAFTNYPEIKKIVHQSSVTIPVNGQNKTFSSTDKLLGSFPGIQGIKTGHVDGAYTFLGAASRNSIQLYSCVLGCKTSSGRFSDSAHLLDYGFSRYQKNLIASNKLVLGYKLNPFSMYLKSPITYKDDVVVYQLSSNFNVNADTHNFGDVTLGLPYDTVGITAWSQDGVPVAYQPKTLGKIQHLPGCFDPSLRRYLAVNERE